MTSVKAQVVVARTYALYQAGAARDARFDLESTINDQVYAGAQTEDWRSARAVRETVGEVLVTKSGTVVQAYYHSCCGGMTELPENVWGQRGVLRKTVKDPSALTRPTETGRTLLDPGEFARRLAAGGRGGGFVTSVKVLQRTKADRALRVRIDTTKGPVTLSGNELRRLVGYAKGQERGLQSDLRRRQIRFPWSRCWPRSGNVSVGRQGHGRQRQIHLPTDSRPLLSGPLHPQSLQEEKKRSTVRHLSLAVPCTPPSLTTSCPKS